MDRDRFDEKDSDFVRSLRQVQSTFAVMQIELNELAEAMAQVRGESLVPVEVSRMVASAIAHAKRP